MILKNDYEKEKKREEKIMKREAFIYTWSTDDDTDRDDNMCFHMRMYGIDDEGRNVCVHVEDFMPYFYVELKGVSEREAEEYEKGIERNLLTMMGFHSRSECRHKMTPNDCAYCWRGEIKRRSGCQKLYFHHGKQLFPMFKISFRSNVLRKKMYYRLQNKKIQVGYKDVRSEVLIHENDANPILQFCTQTKIDSAGWVSWKKTSRCMYTTMNKETLCEREVIRSWDEIFRPKCADERSPPVPKIMSFDIEVYSSVPSRMPDPNVETDVVFQISAVFSDDTSHLLSLGKPIQSVVGRSVVVHEFETEQKLLLGFTQLIRRHMPNVIIGYNIFGFDLTYMIARAKMHGIMDVFDQMGFRVYTRQGGCCHAVEKEIRWASAAYSVQNFYFLDAEGCLFIDLLPVIRRDYKFDNYRLKTISEHFIGDTKDPITPKEIFASYARLQSKDKNRFHLLSQVGKYCVQDSNLVLRIFDKIQTWIGLCEMAKACRVPILTLYTQGQQIKVFSQLYFQCTHDGIIVQSYNSLSDDKDHIQGADHYSGAIVLTPDPGIYDWIIPFDFSSLYPTTIIAYNIDFSTFVIDPKVPDHACHVIEWWDHIGCEHDVEKHATRPKQVVCQKFRYRFLKEPIGVIPRALIQLLEQRKQTKNLMKKVSREIDADPKNPRLQTLYQVYDKRQLAYKVSANSMYGAMGVQKGYLPFLPGAMCTTAMGRASIQKAAEYVRRQFDGKIVYGDTDSIYCHFPLEAQTDFAKRLWDHAKLIEKDLLKLFPPPMKLVFEEKIYKKFLILTKKRYMALTCGHEGNNEDHLTIRGVLLARRDNARWVRGVYEYIARSIMDAVSFKVVVEHVVDDLLDLFRRMVSIKQLIISKTLGKDYATRQLPDDEKKKTKRLQDLGIDTKDAGWEDRYIQRSKPAHVQLAEKMQSRGVVVEAGSRIEFVIVRHPSLNPRLFDRIEDPQYIMEHGDVVHVDPLYYAENLINPTDQILEIGYRKKDVVKSLVATHARFRQLMDELLWTCHPYEFRRRDGSVEHHPDMTRFRRASSKKSKKTETKTTITKKTSLTPTPTKPVQKKTSSTPAQNKTQSRKKKTPQPSIEALAHDLLMSSSSHP